MAKRITEAQLRSMANRIDRQNRQAMKQAVKKAEREINREIAKAEKKAVADHNRQVAAYNRKNRQRLNAAVARLNKQTVTTTYAVEYRQSFDVLQHASARVEELGSSEYLLDLADGETANSAEALNTLLEESPDGTVRDVDEGELADLQATSLGEEYDALSPDFQNRWTGALYALSPRNPDAARQFCTSAREILVGLVDDAATDAEVIAAHPDCERKDDGRVARRAKIAYRLARENYPAGAWPEMVEADVNNVLDLFNTVNRGTHGAAGRYDLDALVAIKRRVEDALRFLHVLLN